MIHTLAQTLAICAALFSQGAQDQPIEARIEVKNTRAERVLAQIKAPELHLGDAKISQLRADPRGNALVFMAPPQTVEDMRQLVRLLDLVPTRVEMQVRLLRVRSEEGRFVEETLSEARLVTFNNRTAILSGSDPFWETEAKIVPRINGDRSISMRCEFSMSAEPGTRIDFLPATQRVVSGKVLTISFTRGPDEKTVGINSNAVIPAGHYGYRLEIKPTVHAR